MANFVLYFTTILKKSFSEVVKFLSYVKATAEYAGAVFFLNC